MPSNEVNSRTLPDTTVRWTGLGHWNFYFLIKLLLFWNGYLQFNVFTTSCLLRHSCFR
ncbi:cellulose biosynthesis protein BcsG [Orrella marina]|uniref:cellulose biosynthesis protein BcsG n=1 Tax=Orrella marina TaxID=2163011 RepID=UPI001D13127D|nr:cellulose biosynthesis protein BcsG [Orrella marina]